MNLRNTRAVGYLLSVILIFNFSMVTTSPASAASNNCLTFTVENAFDSADFYAFSLYMTNKCSKIVKLSGEFYAKTSNGSVYGRPSDAIISFHGNNICGGGNYFSHYFNPKEQTSDSICLSVRRGMTITSFFFANSPVSKPALSKSVRMKLR
jgi:hypothetical protein